MSYASALSQPAAGYHSVLCLESAPVEKAIKINKLKIAVVAACPFPVPRGTPIRILRLAEAVAERGHEVHVVTYHLGSGPVAEAVHVHRVADIPGYRKLGPGPTLRKLVQVDPALTVLLRKLHKRERFDVIHAHHFEGLLVGMAARLGRRVPLVFDAHTLLMSELPYYSMGLPTAVKAMLGRWGDRLLPGLADHTISVTHTIRDKLVSQVGLDPARVSVISNGIELEHFDPARLEPTSGRVGKRLIFTGNLAQYQGIDLMLRAFRRVAAQVPEARLRIATDSSFAPYEELARELGIRERIDLIPSPGFAALPAVLAGADIALNPRPVCDGIPVKLLNYMAAARPTVSFAGSAPGVTHALNGWLAESGDVEAFAAGVVALLQDPVRAETIGRAGRDYVVKHCSWPNAAERCEEIFLSLRAGTTQKILGQGAV
jgi:glycosyltransferase involved in cell wall biosynthesis